MTFVPPKILFLDMEGTLFLKEHRLDDGRVAPSAWTVLAECLGPECLRKEKETKDFWIAGKYRSYLDWMRATVDIHVQHGLTHNIFREIVDGVDYTPYVAEALREVRDWGTITAIITGGFKAIADRAQVDLKIDHVFAGCEYFFDPTSGLVRHYNLLPADEMGKVEFMKLVCREYHVPPVHCAFVGHGKNDVELARAVGFSVAFNAQPELESVVSVSIRQQRDEVDFRAVVDAVRERYVP
jgi:phosphoserine phosphatase